MTRSMTRSMTNTRKKLPKPPAQAIPHAATRTIVQLAAAASLLSSPAIAAASVAADRVALPSSAVVHEDIVHVSDLLPGSAPESLRAPLQAINLGPAPLPGAHRIFPRDRIVEALSAAPASQALLDIPAAIDVTRWSRPLTRADLLPSILESFQANHLAGAESLAAQDISLASLVLVTEDAPKFEVTRIDSAPKGAARVHILIVSEPRVPPFWVTLHRTIKPQASAPGCLPSASCNPESSERPAPASPAIEQALANSAAAKASKTFLQPRQVYIPPAASSSSAGPILVKAGQPVQLLVQGAGMRIATTAIPLDLGREGDRIRVHTALSGKILIATVVAPQTVQVDY